MLKARNVRGTLNGRIDPELLHVIEAMIEEQNAMGQSIHSLAQLFDQMMDSMINLSNAAGMLNDNLKKLAAPKTEPTE